jgi:Domain of unknown function (DUF4365)
LAKQRPTPPGKRRTREHVLADLSINYVERQILQCGFSAERTERDYGYDLTVATYNETGEIEPGLVYVQVKAADQLPWLAGAKDFSWPVSRRDLRLWLREAYPVVLVVYEGRTERAYWLSVQDHFAGRTAAELFGAGEWIRVHISATQRFKPIDPPDRPEEERSPSPV